MLLLLNFCTKNPKYVCRNVNVMVNVQDFSLIPKNFVARKSWILNRRSGGGGGEIFRVKNLTLLTATPGGV